MSRLQRSMAAAGVPVGATTANQPTMSKPVSFSASAGTASQPATRCAAVVASTRRRPWRANAAVEARSATIASTCPPIRSCVPTPTLA